MLKSTHWKEWIAVLLLFGTGSLVGAGLMRLYMGMHPPPPLPEPRVLKERILERLDHELGLSQEQYESIRRIIADSFRRSMEIRRPIDSKIDELVKEQFQAILKTLNPDQQEKFKVLHRQFEKRRREFHRPPPPPPPPPHNG